MKVYVIDYETTGTPEDPAPEVIEMGRVTVDLEERTVSEPFYRLARPRGPIPPETMAVHHLQMSDLEDCLEANQYWPEFWGGLGAEEYAVAHNAEFEQHFYPGVGKGWICTYKCALRAWPDAPGHGNQVLRYWLGLDEVAGFNRDLAMPPHRAMPDAYVTGHIFLKLLDHFESLDQMAEVSAQPALMHKLTFGKHRGQRFDEVPVDYLQWIRDKSELGEDAKFSAAYWIQRRAA
jgi:exodeoxyribonuclease X